MSHVQPPPRRPDVLKASVTSATCWKFRRSAFTFSYISGGCVRVLHHADGGDVRRSPGIPLELLLSIPSPAKNLSTTFLESGGDSKNLPRHLRQFPAALAAAGRCGSLAAA